MEGKVCSMWLLRMCVLFCIEEFSGLSVKHEEYETITKTGRQKTLIGRQSDNWTISSCDNDTVLVMQTIFL